MWKDELRTALDRRRERGILRGLKRYEIAQDESVGAAAEASASGSSSSTPPALVDFSSNDYMGLARCPELRRGVIERMQTADEQCSPKSIGSTGSRLLDGNTRAHEELEKRLTHHFGAPDALLFNSGFDANSSLLSVLPQPGDFVLYDELVHASMHDGMRTSRIDRSCRIAFAHNDLRDMEDKLDHIIRADAIASTRSKSTKQANIFVLVEAAYSMDGDTCPLQSLIAAVNAKVPRSRRCILVDEAHTVGLYGLNGAGLCDAMGVQNQVDIRLVTFGKAFGCSGAAVLCQSIVKLFLINYARPLIYSTAMPHTSLYAIHGALDILSTPAGTLRATRTFALTQAFVDQMKTVLASDADSSGALPVSFPSSLVAARAQSSAKIPVPPIIPVITPKARELAQFLIANGFLVRPICYPTVPKGLDRVRICIHAHNQDDEIESLARAIARWVRQEQQTMDVKHPPTSDPLEKARL